MNKLKDLCFYFLGKIDVQECNFNNYVSTENMISNLGGITKASTIPSIAYVSKYEKEDILLSNIRPYFKKLWYAKYTGGCSNDVLVIRANNQTYPKFLYYVLSQQAFFDYNSKSAKGTKMPRGDKKAIMDYEVKYMPSFAEQKAIAVVLSALDDKIELNNRINKNLEEQAQAIFKRWFVDFEFPDENGNPYKSSGGVMTDSELGEIPKGWRVGKLDDIAIIQTGKRPENKDENISDENPIAILGASGVMGYTAKTLLNELILVIGRVGTHGVIQKIDYPCWVSDNAIYFKTNFYAYFYQILKTIDYKALNRGSTQPLITQTDIKNQTILLSDKIELYEKSVIPLIRKILHNEKQNQNLTELRDYLLPKLMSGEIRVDYKE